MRTTPVRGPPPKLTTCAGERRRACVASPSCPSEFKPHAQTVPSDLSASECFSPAATATTPERPGTCAGVARPLVVPSPSCPSKLLPHAQTVPSERTASPCASPAAIAVTPERLAACTGEVTGTPLPAPVPNCPPSLSPKPQTVPS